MTPTRAWLLWTASFVAYPLGGIAGRHADSFVAALVGGLITGAVIGAGQSLVSARRLDRRRWVPASALGMGVGLAAGAATVGYGTSLAELAVQGAVTGLAFGLAQTVALPTVARERWLWAAALPPLWALGWTVTTLVGVRVDEHFTVFGSTGAVTVSALLGLLLQHIVPVPARTEVLS